MDNELSRMPVQQVVEKSLALVEQCDIVTIGSNGEDGHPNIKAMIKVESDGISTFWFSTNTSTRRVSQFLVDSKACAYFHLPTQFKGLMLVGEMEVMQDLPTKERLWRDGCEIYYPQGVEDPDYTVLRFKARQGNYYEGLGNVTFDIGQA